MRVSAANTGSIVTVAGALGVAVSAGSAGVGASIGVSVAISSIATTVRARVEDSVLRVANAGVTVKASDEASITAIAIGGAVAVQAGAAGVAIAVGTSVAVNKVFNTVEATVSGGRIETGGGKLTLSATQQADILSVVLGASVAVSAGSSANAAIGGGGALARNVISASVRAGISGAIIDTRASGGAAGAVDVLALGLSRINAVVLGMSASVSVSQYAAASASIGVAMAENVIGYDVNSAGQVVALGAGRPVNEIVAFIDRSAVTAGAVSVDARNVSFKANGDVDRKQSIDAVVVAGAVAVSVAYAPPRRRRRQPGRLRRRAGARAVNKIQTGITARISDQNQQNRFEAGSVTVRALDQAEINSTIAAVAIAVAVSLCDRRLVGGRLAGAERDRQHHAGDHGWRADRRRAGDHGQGRQPGRHHDRVGRGVGERGRGPGRRLARGRRRQCAQPDRLVRDGAGQRLAHRRQCRQCLEYRCRHERHHQGDRGGRQRGFTAAGACWPLARRWPRTASRKRPGARRTDWQQAVQPGRGVGHGRHACSGWKPRSGPARWRWPWAAWRWPSRRGGLQHEQGGHPCLCGWPDPGRHRRARAAESLTVKATNTSTLEATAVGASAAGTGSGLALSVGAAVAGNKTLGAVEACVDNSVLSVSGTGAQMARLSVAAQDGSTLKAKAVGASLAFSMQGGSVAVGATDVKNVAAASVQARVSGATITVSDGVSVTARNGHGGQCLRGGLGGGRADGSGGFRRGRGQFPVVANETGSRLTGSTVTAGTGVSVTAENTSTITAVTGAVAASVTGAGLGASMGVSIASNTFGAYSGDGVTRTNGAQAYIANSTVTVAKGNLDVLATSSETLNSVNFAGALAVVGAGVAVAGSGVQVSNRYASNTSAYIDGSTITVGIDGERGSLTVRAKDDSIIERSAAYGVRRRRWPGARRQRVAGGVAGRHHGGKHRVGLYRHGRRQGGRRL